MNLDSPVSSISLPPYYPRKSHSPPPPDISDYNPDPPDAISPTFPTPPTNEPFSTIALEEIKVETATLIRHVESNFLRQSNQRNRLQSANKMLFDQNLALQSKVRDLETKLSDCILPSEHRRLQHQYIQEVGHLTANLQRRTELLASVRDQHEAQVAARRECQANLTHSYIETERLRQSTDAQVSVIADLRIQLEGKENIALAKAQDETKNLRQVIATHCENVSKLPVQSTAEPILSSVTDDSSFQSLSRRHGRLSLEVKEVRQMMEQFISSAQSRRPEFTMVEHRDNMDARSSPETIHLGWGSSQDLPPNHGFHEQPIPLDSRCSVPPVRNISTSKFNAFPGNLTIHSSHLAETNHVSIDSFQHSSSAGDESAPGFDVISAFEQSSRTSQATTIEHFPYENMDDLDLPNPSHSRDMEHVEDAEFQKIKMEGAKLSLHIERWLQQQITAQTNARSLILADRSHVKYVSERDAERRQQIGRAHV